MSLQAYVDGRKPATKAALRAAVRTAPDTVRFDDTAAIGNRGMLSVADVKPSDVIVGPDVYRSRRWYANIRNGKVV